MESSSIVELLVSDVDLRVVIGTIRSLGVDCAGLACCDGSDFVSDRGSPVVESPRWRRIVEPNESRTCIKLSLSFVTLPNWSIRVVI